MSAGTPGVRLGVLSDLHLTPDPERPLAWHNEFDLAGVLPRLRTALGWFAEREVDAVLVLGDLSHDGDEESMARVPDALAQSWDGPAMVISGNHDAKLPTPQGIEVKGLRIAALDPGAGVAAATADVLISHWPVISRAKAFAAAGLAYAGDRADADAIAAGLAARPAPTLLLTGHLHARDSVREGALAQMTVGALVEPPYEATVITVRAAGPELTAGRQARELPGPAPAGTSPALVPATETLTVRAAA